MKSIRLVDVYAQQPDNMAATLFLYELLAERDPVANISHRKMPTLEQHTAFVESRPYSEWFIIFGPDKPVGSIYLSKQNEIGVFIAKTEQGNDCAKAAVKLLMQINPGKRFLANIAPGNARSLAMFEGLGFELIQMTLAREIYRDDQTKAG